MKMIFQELELSFEIHNNVPNILVIESPTYFSLIVSAINSSITGDSKSCHICDNLELIELTKNAFICFSPFLIDLNDKRFITYAIKQLHLIVSNDPELQIEISESFSHLESIILKLIEKSDFDLDLSKNLSLDSILKSLNPIYNSEDLSLFNMTMEYICLISKVMPKNSILFFVNLYSYFEENEILELSKFSQAMEVCLIDIENNFKSNTSLCIANLTILDKDLCII